METPTTRGWTTTSGSRSRLTGRSREKRDALRSFLNYEATKWQYTHGVKDPELVERLAGLVVELEDPAQQGVENGRAGIEADGRRECADRLVPATQVPQIEGEVQVDGAPRGVEGDNLPRLPDRLARSVGPGERGTEIVVGERDPRADGQRGRACCQKAIMQRNSQSVLNSKLVS